MVINTQLFNWEVEEIQNINGTEFPAILKLMYKEWGRKEKFVFPLATAAEKNEIWQVGNMEFVIYNKPELYHVEFQPNSGYSLIFRAAAHSPARMENEAFFYFEDVRHNAYIYSVADRKLLSEVFKEIIDPDVKTVVEKPTREAPLMIRLEAPYLTTCFEMADSVESMDYKEFAAEAKRRCEEARIAKYYEMCGGYYLCCKRDLGPVQKTMVRGYLNENGEYQPDEFFKIITNRLVEVNNLYPTLPNYQCSFYGKAIEDDDFSVGLSHDVLIIKDKQKNKIFALEMYGKNCVGLKRTGKWEFFALLANPYVGWHNTDPMELKCFDYLMGDRFQWQTGVYRLPDNAIIRPNCCQLDDDTIVFVDGEKSKDYNVYSSFEMWSISKNRRANLIDDFEDLKDATRGPYVSYTERLIMVRNPHPIKTRPMIALRLYAPKEYCDVFALIDPSLEYRVYGKVYNMLADSILEGPKTVYDLVEMFQNNRDLKLKYSL